MADIRVILADDHPALREGIARLLNDAPDITVIGEASNGTEALRLARELQPDVLLLDMELPGLTGVEVGRRLKAAQSAVRILAFSAFDDARYVRGVLASGAAGYLTKEETTDTLVEAVRGVARGEEGWLSQRAAARMTAWTRKEDAESTDLTPRELEVLQLVTTGSTNQEIGSLLGISDRTVEKHLEAVFAKLGVASRTEAAVLAISEGLL